MMYQTTGRRMFIAPNCRSGRCACRPPTLPIAPPVCGSRPWGPKAGSRTPRLGVARRGHTGERRRPAYTFRLWMSWVSSTGDTGHGLSKEMRPTKRVLPMRAELHCPGQEKPKGHHAQLTHHF